MSSAIRDIFFFFICFFRVPCGGEGVSTTSVKRRSLPKRSLLSPGGSKHQFYSWCAVRVQSKLYRYTSVTFHKEPTNLQTYALMKLGEVKTLFYKTGVENFFQKLYTRFRCGNCGGVGAVSAGGGSRWQKSNCPKMMNTRIFSNLSTRGFNNVSQATVTSQTIDHSWVQEDRNTNFIPLYICYIPYETEKLTQLCSYDIRRSTDSFLQDRRGEKNSKYCIQGFGAKIELQGKRHGKIRIAHK